MDTVERKARFTEIVMAVELLPEDTEDMPVMPNRTQGLADGTLKSALVSQAFNEGEKFTQKLVNVLVGSAISNVRDSEGKLTQEDMGALTLACSLAWASGELKYLLNLCGVVGAMTNNDENSDINLLELGMLFRPNARAKEFKKFAPYDILEDKIDLEDIIKVAQGGDEEEDEE